MAIVIRIKRGKTNFINGMFCLARCLAIFLVFFIKSYILAKSFGY